MRSQDKMRNLIGQNSILKTYVIITPTTTSTTTAESHTASTPPVDTTPTASFQLHRNKRRRRSSLSSPCPEQLSPTLDMPASKSKIAKPTAPKIPSVLTRNTFSQLAVSQRSDDLPATQLPPVPPTTPIDLHSYPQLPDFLLAMQQQLRRHEAKFLEFETLLAENTTLKKELHAAQSRIRELEAAQSDRPAPVASNSSPEIQRGTEASRYATVAASHTSFPPLPRPSTTRAQGQRLPRPARASPAAREAVSRTFSRTSDSQGFSFIYLHCRGKEPISKMREKLRILKLQSSRLIDIHYPSNHVMAILLHNDYLEEATNLLTLNQIELLTFDPTSLEHLNDPKYTDLTPEQRSSEACEIYQQRLCHMITRIRNEHRQIAVARSFRKQAWITEDQFTNIVHTIRPPTQKPTISTSTAMQLDSNDTSPADGSTSAHSN
ncbi:hypothetical protein A0J61_08198 [Choanephora cucurbitarum]|uniref:Uncharacterized protein n=1 Tax=Choanephora cucurbitarum TaxID=101091 RepID=A0A1C7N3W1_9FUNG|nr:hypothetical protein A0J61_08198 [Choanephora cucurbitarum]